MKYLILITVLSFVSFSQTSQLDSRETIIPTKNGILQGGIQKDYWGNEYLSFRGIPFAQSPVGILRFKAPLPAKPWSGVLNATKYNSACPQGMFPPDGQYLTNEDCLYLNVFTTKINASRPVMVFVHGGAFLVGDAGIYGPQFLIREDIVLVTIQYRLGVFGFLGFEDPEVGISGNFGFKDQVLALKWVQENIYAFGGNPGQVTVFGESAGSASTQLLVVSPMTKGLFHRAISQSGAATNFWTSGPKDGSYKYAEFVNCTSKGVNKIAECLRSKPVKDLLKAVEDLGTSVLSDRIYSEIQKEHIGELAPFQFVTIERKSQSEEPFLTETPAAIIKAGKFNKVVFMTGYCTDEGYGFTEIMPFETQNDDYEILVPRDFNLIRGSNKSKETGKAIKEFYWGKQTPSSKKVDEFSKYLTDIIFMYQMFENAKEFAKYVPVYFYNFNYKLLYNFDLLLDKLKIGQKNGIVYHANDLSYLFYTKGRTPDNITVDSKGYVAISRMTKLWTQFAKSKQGDPNQDEPINAVYWKKFTPEMTNYLKIDETFEMKTDPLAKRLKFWKNLYESK